MRAIVVDAPGGPEQLALRDVPAPVPAPGEVLVGVRATAVNRADLLQRMGFYPPPPGASEILGLECSGTVLEDRGGGWRPGTPVCALLAGGGYAEMVAVPGGQVLPLPEGIDLLTAGGIPEVFLTAHDALATRARLAPGEWVLVLGGAGGVGTAAIQIARRMGAHVIATAGSPERLERCSALGAEGLVDHRREDVVARVHELTEGRGVDAVLDVMGASRLAANLACLATDGRLVVIGLQGGTTAELDLGLVLRRRITVVGTTLRGRPLDQKAAVVARARDVLLGGFADGSLRPVVHAVYPLEQAAEAHRAMEAGVQVGKLLLEVAPG